MLRKIEEKRNRKLRAVKIQSNNADTLG